MNHQNAIQETRKALYKIEELAGNSQQLWDNAWTNAVIADHPDKDGYTQQTYQATRIHAECMDVLRKLLSDLQELAEAEASGIVRFTN
jgi:hypothetical protein